ncbi:PqqD family peptide modification chaperone [Laspinema palackyanum]|uniref:PqqD family peptide modification chaperone n=1 Tax=Laspinema palackyanum TaxID=3231601 RepID=UPI00345E0149|nr:PqqD family peptide modification chaperone [Laspinema sp. D2c]
MSEPLQTSSGKQSNLSLATVVVQNPDLLDCELDEDLVLMSIENEAYYGMNGIGKRIWWAMATPVSVQALCEQLQQQFEVDPLACENEVMNYLNTLLVEGLIHEV